MPDLLYFCGEKGHLICVPYSVENLRQMAEELSLHKDWFRNGRIPHYVIPEQMVEEIQEQCIVVPTREIVKMTRGPGRPKKQTPTEKYEEVQSMKPETRKIFTIRVVYKSGYVHDFDCYSFRMEQGKWLWETVSSANRPLDLGMNDIAAVWQIGVKE